MTNRPLHGGILVLMTVISAVIVWAACAAFLLLSSARFTVSIVDPGVIVVSLLSGALIGILWSSVVKRRVTEPLARLTKFANRLIDAQPDAPSESLPQDSPIPELHSAMKRLAAKMDEDRRNFRRVERVRSEFLGNVSHELRTPIFALQGFIETLLNGAVDDPEVNRRFLERAFNQTIRLNNLLRDLIEISRIESGDMKLSLRYFDIREFIAHIVEEMHDVAAQSDITLSFETAVKDEVQVLGDRQRIKQVCENLIENAIKYNVQNGHVIVELIENKNDVRMVVKDSGIGIPDEHLERIFERFYRVDKDRSREVGGTGLGLAIVKHIVLAHKGRVEVSSEMGSGSNFTVIFRK